jgi:CubicO group peptidase (beta-lactamase class C family)
MTGATANKTILPRTEPQAVGMSSARLARIITVLNGEVEAGQSPGAVIAVARRGHLVFHEAVGSLGPDRGTPVPRDALFAIASMTKPVTGVAGLMLISTSHKCCRQAAHSAGPESWAAKPSRQCGPTE